MSKTLNNARFFFKSDIHPWMLDKYADNSLDSLKNASFCFDIIDQPFYCAINSQGEYIDISLSIRSEIGVLASDIDVKFFTDERTPEVISNSGRLGDNAGNTLSLFLTAANALCRYALEKELVDELSNMNTDNEGAIILLCDDELSFERVSGRARPDLACTTLFGGVQMGRPYLDEGMGNLFGFNSGRKTIKELEKEAKSGSCEAMSELAERYLNADGVKVNFPKAFQWMKKAANAGNSSAQFNLAIFYAKGCGTERDFNQAAKWMQKAADNDDYDAEENLPKYQSIVGDIQQAKEGNAEAQARVAEFYGSIASSIWQMDNDDDYKISLRWAKESARQNCVEGIWILALAYLHGRGTRRNSKKALAEFERAAALGHAQSMQNIGAMYMEGDGVKEDHQKAFEWFKKAAQNGHILACGAVGNMYENGDGVEANREEAIKWYTIAAEANDADAQCCLGMLYTGTANESIEIEKVLYWLEKAIANGSFRACQQHDIWSYVKDKMDTGEMNRNEKDPLGWIINAAQNGDSDAAELMGMLSDDEGEEFDEDEE